MTRKDPFVALLASNAWHARILAHAFCAANDAHELYACIRMARRLDELPEGDYLAGCYFTGWDVEDVVDFATLRDLAIEFVEGDDARADKLAAELRSALDPQGLRFWKDDDAFAPEIGIWCADTDDLNESPDLIGAGADLCSALEDALKTVRGWQS